MTRAYSDAIIVRLISDNGEVGFGEGMPRPYVTGETVSSSLDQIHGVLLPLVGQHSFSGPASHADLSGQMSDINTLLPSGGRGAVIAFNASKAAIELALIDLLLKVHDKSLGNLILPCAESVTYSAVITADSTETVRKIALQCSEYGIRQIKIKVGTGDDYARIATVRETLGGSISLRVDANCAFDVKGALAFISSIQSFDIECIEQPVPRGHVSDLAVIRRNSPVLVMADESIITEEDASELIEKEACDLFNLRISKNGGIFRTLQLAGMAREAGLGFQLGCQVGETAILSAAGRHMAAHLNDAKYVEGSYGALLLEEDIADESVQFGYAGMAPLLKGPGLGITVREDLLDKYAIKTIEMEM